MGCKHLLIDDAIRLQLPSVTHDEAIAHAGQLLVKLGYVNQSYVATMFEREATISTFIGHGTAIPHGMVHGPEVVHKSGIVLLQYPNGIHYDDHICYLVIGIASTTDDHLDILQHIATILQQKSVAATLWTTTDPNTVIDIFCQEHPS